MALTLQTQVSGDVFILHCDGRIVFGDEGAALRERVRNLLKGSPKIVVNLASVEHVDSEGLGILVGLFTSARNRGGELNWYPLTAMSKVRCIAQPWIKYSPFTGTTTRRSQPSGNMRPDVVRVLRKRACISLSLD